MPFACVRVCVRGGLNPYLIAAAVLPARQVKGGSSTWVSNVPAWSPAKLGPLCVVSPVWRCEQCACMVAHQAGGPGFPAACPPAAAATASETHPPHGRTRSASAHSTAGALNGTEKMGWLEDGPAVSRSAHTAE
eukprot:1159586-Pelagomonas_calceolata.AAC.9